MCKYYVNHKDRLKENEAKNLFAKIKPLLEAEENEEQINSLISSYEEFDKKFTGKNYFNYGKTISLVQYVASKVDDLFQTKLFKLLFYIDFYNYKQYNKSITGIPYCKFKFGPVPDDYEKFIRVLRYSDNLKVEDIFDDESTKVHICSSKEVELNCFTAEEVEVIKKVTTFLKKYNAKQLSDLSHEEDAYQLTADRQFIDYKFAESLKFFD